jgi:UDP-N-acetylmuramoyl-L-alanyl-D-glutamate--2,6-diaminopimelate ligase
VKVSLTQILAALHNPVRHGYDMFRVPGVTYDTRNATPGGLFAAITGEASDGHKFIPKAIEAGAAAVLAERQPSVGYTGFPWITVQDTKKALGAVAALMFSMPTEKLVLVGITGTNGKTTLTYLLESITKAAGGFPGVVGTVSYWWGDQ